MPDQQQPFLHRTKGKVIAAFFLAAAAIILSVSIAYFSLGELVEQVDSVSTPNEKIQILNRFFREVTRVEQKHRAEAIKNPQHASKRILEESQALMITLDTLLALPWNNDQVERLLAMEKILQERNRLFLRYLRERSMQANNNDYLTQLDSLSQFLLHYNPEPDSNVVTTQRKTTTTTFIPGTEKTKKDERSFFGRLFGSKKNITDNNSLVEVREELSIITDTVAIVRQDSAIEQIGKIMLNLEQVQREQRAQLMSRELALTETSTLLLNQLLTILHEVESEETALLQANNERAVALVNTGINRTLILIVVFFLALAVLVFFILSDIYRSQYYRQQLEEAKDQADQLRQVKERFLANMSHEIRTPLQSIIGFSEQLSSTKNNQTAIEAIQRSSEHLLHIVDEVLDYSRIESGKFTLEREPFNLKNLLHEIEAAFRLQTDKKGLAFIVEMDGVKNINLLGDAFRLRQILYNLLSNAVKFTEKGFVKLQVKAEDAGFRLQCRFVIEDTGIGIHQEDLNRIFQHFEQANSAISQQYGGTGLGLTIVKALVDAQYGEVKAESKPGNGATFTVELGFDKAPFTSAPEKKHQPKQPQQKIIEGQVLVVDDDPLILKVCGLILQKNNIPFTTVQFPETLLKETPPDNVSHVLMDIRMPVVNGINLCVELKKSLSPKTRFIALTAHALPEEQKKLKTYGFDDILTKPFREHELLLALGMHKYPEQESGLPKLYNPAVLEQLTLGDTTLFQDVVGQFCHDTSAELSELQKFVSEDESSKGREIIHKLAGRTGQMGATALSKKFSALEMRLEQGTKINLLADSIDEATTETRKLMEQLQQKSNAFG
ncbi:MAG TPA: ATP-binding protein [Cyclobacteriaceae bacterium]|nr:ATP-binding protein [Cyclobacteriaceae bacterium]HRJ82196.1 ATP-binding protein [Cyclobacteriaceae bacterium]